MVGSKMGTHSRPLVAENSVAMIGRANIETPLGDRLVRKFNLILVDAVKLACPARAREIQ